MTHVLYPIFEEKSIGNCLRYARGLPSHAHRRRQQQPGRVRQVGTSYFQKHTWHMFYTEYFKRNRLEMVSDMSDASKLCLSMSTRPSPTNVYEFQKLTYTCHMFYIGIQFFKRNRLRMIPDMSEASYGHAH